MMRDLSIYIHIPFCVRKCRYCDFLSYSASAAEREAYVELLLTEIEKLSLFYKTHRVISVFIGGGTPSLLEEEAIERIIGELNHDFIFCKTPEITIEANPGTVTQDKLRCWKRIGINRLSIGLQSADDEELKTLGRIHDFHTFCNMYDAACKAGFQNVNIDILSAVPGQTMQSYERTLKKVLALAPAHISAYSLILEEGTWFYTHKDELAFPTEDEDRQLYELTGEMLAEYGYERYEISNYARPGYECVHNNVYWKRGDYAGFGLGAASMAEEVRWNNRRDLPGYRDAVRGCLQEKQEPDPRKRKALRHALAGDVTYLTREEQMEEFMFLGLRLINGVSKRDFEEKFGISMCAVYGDVIEDLKKKKLLLEDERVRLTPYGIDISNYVMAKFLL